MEQIAAAAKFLAALQLAGAAAPAVLVALETGQAADGKDCHSDLGIVTEK